MYSINAQRLRRSGANRTRRDGGNDVNDPKRACSECHACVMTFRLICLRSWIILRSKSVAGSRAELRLSLRSANRERDHEYRQRPLAHSAHTPHFRDDDCYVGFSAAKEAQHRHADDRRHGLERFRRLWWGREPRPSIRRSTASLRKEPCSRAGMVRQVVPPAAPRL